MEIKVVITLDPKVEKLLEQLIQIKSIPTTVETVVRGTVKPAAKKAVDNPAKEIKAAPTKPTPLVEVPADEQDPTYWFPQDNAEATTEPPAVVATVDDVRKAIAAYRARGGQSVKALELLQKYNAKDVSSLQEGDRSTFIKDLEALRS